MRITKIEGTVKELTEFYGAFQTDNKKPSIENFPRENKIFPKFKSQEEIVALVDETVAKLKKKEFTHYDVSNFLCALKAYITNHPLTF